MADDWHYDGDVGIRHGGMYWNSSDDADSVTVVRVSPLSDEGGPDNVFRVEKGYVDVTEGERLAEALSASGCAPEDASLTDKVRAAVAYGGMEVDEDWVVRIGAADSMWNGRGPDPEPDRVLSANAGLRNFVVREFLATAPAPSGPRT